MFRNAYLGVTGSLYVRSVSVMAIIIFHDESNAYLTTPAIDKISEAI
jgi:hypothetical protein